MDLLARLEGDLRTEEGCFRAQLLREDVARLRRLQELAAAAPDIEAFKKAGRAIGWTPGDARSWELRNTLDPLLEAFYAAATCKGGEADGRLLAAWEAFHRQRIERLVGCLSRVPRPRD